MVRSLAQDRDARQAMAAAALTGAPAHSRESQAREMLALFEAAVKP